ncbi:acyltransferase [Pseudomonas sp. RP23018S]|uniref:acyltransferase family protein n=1 Tax=Pseudomonas sp. RP23018S TaxID=3096037 RepID=UPI002ACA950B|nr:acyltransferase [Pseudomonas sp. RP23018S]MDZ5601444.1 acyltransferase [Pseudomonas sp. RP23018S]
MPAASPSAERLYTLDTLRGLAALSVVFWHWQHFFYIGDSPAAFESARQPFFTMLTPLYQYGGLAVQLFFSISGFVFFWLFAQRVAAGSISVRSFVVDRFSRLYPLHLLTFGGVAGLQGIYCIVHGSDFVYLYNDTYHALLNLLLAPAWGLEKGWSYNAPIWSVSVEVLLYALFFIICLAGRWRWLLAVIACGAGLMLYPGSYKVGSGLLCFFAGGLAYAVLWQLRRWGGSGFALLMCGCVTAGAWASQLWLRDTLDVYLVMCLCFPATLTLLAAAGLHWHGLLRSTGWIGDISYSSYLLHFPLQIVFALVFDRLGFDREVFYQPWVMLSFFTVLVPMSLVCHQWVERPAQRWLRHSRLARGRRPEGRAVV